MSLSNNKAALFGGGTKKGSSTGSTSSSTAGRTSAASSSSTATTSTTSKTTGKTSTSSGTASAALEAQKAKNVEEATTFVAKGNGYLKTSMMQLSPDYVAAATMFERAADLYNRGGDLHLAIEAILKAADCHDGYKAMSSVAVAKGKAAGFARTLGDGARCAELLQSSAEFWGLSGDLVKYGETLAKAAKELEDVDANAAESQYVQALEVMFPPPIRNDTPQQIASQIAPTTVDVIRNNLSFLVRLRKKSEALVLAQEIMVPIFNAMDMPGALHKTLASITILQLSLGDANKAQQTYLQEHMNVQGYLASKECELSDDLVMAFTTADIDKLTKAQKSYEMNHLDMEVSKLGRQLTIFDAVYTAPSAGASFDIGVGTGTGTGTGEPSSEVQVTKQLDSMNIDEFARGSVSAVKPTTTTNNNSSGSGSSSSSNDVSQGTAMPPPLPPPPPVAVSASSANADDDEDDDDSVDLS